MINNINQYYSVTGDLQQIQINGTSFSSDKNIRGEHIAFMLECGQMRDNIACRKLNRLNFTRNIDSNQVNNSISILSSITRNDYSFSKWLNSDEFTIYDSTQYWDGFYSSTALKCLSAHNKVYEESDFEFELIDEYKRIDKIPIIKNAQNIPKMSLQLVNYSISHQFVNGQLSNHAKYEVNYTGTPPEGWIPYIAGNRIGNTIFSYEDYRYAQTSAIYDETAEKWYYRWGKEYGNTSNLVYDNTAREAVKCGDVSQELENASLPYARFVPVFNIMFTFTKILFGESSTQRFNYTVKGQNKKMFISRYWIRNSEGQSEWHYGISCPMSEFYIATKNTLNLVTGKINQSPKQKSPDEDNNGWSSTYLQAQCNLAGFIAYINEPYSTLN